jgi:hypothetical protein
LHAFNAYWRNEGIEPILRQQVVGMQQYKCDNLNLNILELQDHSLVGSPARFPLHGGSTTVILLIHLLTQEMYSMKNIW